jgi:hypothetical protein
MPQEGAAQAIRLQRLLEGTPCLCKMTPRAKKFAHSLAL